MDSSDVESMMCSDSDDDALADNIPLAKIQRSNQNHQSGPTPVGNMKDPLMVSQKLLSFYGSNSVFAHLLWQNNLRVH